MIGGEDDVLAECDILTKSNQAVETLSGGQQRKLQLAIAFVGGSTMCFIDEASSGLVATANPKSQTLLTGFRILSQDAISGTLSLIVTRAVPS